MTDEPTLAGLGAEIAALRAEITALRDAGAPAAAPPVDTRRVSRRGLLGAALAGGAGLFAAQVTGAAPAAAAPGNAIVLGAINDGGTTITTVRSATGLNSSPFAVVNYNPNGGSIGLYSQLGQQSLVFDGSIGQRAAVMGDSHDESGVSGLSVNGSGVYGQSVNNPGVMALSQEYMAVRAESTGYVGVLGASYSADYPGVRATSVGGPGVEASSTGGAGLVATTGSTGHGVDTTSARGYGVQARGGRAPLRLVPSAKAGAPTTGSHAVGEFSVDKAGFLYLCTVAGNPGTWRRVAFG